MRVHAKAGENFEVLGPDGKPDGRDVLKEVDELRKTMSLEKEHQLVENIVIKTQGFVSGNFHDGDKHPIELLAQWIFSVGWV